MKALDFTIKGNGTHYAQCDRRYTSVSETLRTNLKHVDHGNLDIFKQLRNHRKTKENRAKWKKLEMRFFKIKRGKLISQDIQITAIADIAHNHHNDQKQNVAVTENS